MPVELMFALFEVHADQSFVITLSVVWQQRWHHATAIMDNPGLPQELLDIPPLFRRVVVTVSRRLRQSAQFDDWSPWVFLCWITDCRSARSAVLLVGPMPWISRNFQTPLCAATTAGRYAPSKPTAFSRRAGSPDPPPQAATWSQTAGGSGVNAASAGTTRSRRPPAGATAQTVAAAGSTAPSLLSGDL